METQYEGEEKVVFDSLSHEGHELVVDRDGYWLDANLHGHDFQRFFEFCKMLNDLFYSQNPEFLSCRTSNLSGLISCMVFDHKESMPYELVQT